MKINKSRVILFGASEAGKNFIKNQNEYEIIAIADNDTTKQGSYIMGISVISPTLIPNYDIDFILITSMYVLQIQSQLINDLKINPEKIKLPLKSELKPNYYPFQDKNTLDFAKRLLLYITTIFEEDHINYFINFGTLLGIVRDGDIISWDDDIDVSVYENEIDDVIKCLKSKLRSFDKKIDWTVKTYFEENNRPISIEIMVSPDRHDAMKSFPLSIEVLYFNGETVIQKINQSPKIHFESHEYINIWGGKVRVPYDYKSYLTNTYGDWEKPKKETTFANNSLTFTDTVVSNKIEVWKI